MQSAGGVDLQADVVDKWKEVSKGGGGFTDNALCFMFSWFHFIVNYWITHHSAAVVHPDKMLPRKCDCAHFSLSAEAFWAVSSPPAVSDRNVRARETRLMYIQNMHQRKSLPVTQEQMKRHHCVRRFHEFVSFGFESWFKKKINKIECVLRGQRRTMWTTSSCSLHTFCTIPSCALLQGSKCWNKPWMNKVLFFNM